MDLKSAADLEDLARILRVPAKTLGYYLYRVPIETQYKSFPVSKRRGGFRTIRAPVTNLKLIQRSIAKELESMVTFRTCVNGFVTGRDILRNASLHSGQAHILNIDLADFFGTINFGRVYGLLRKPPYSLHKKIAAAIAKACTVENELPQGAPSSPIISNLICAKLDSELSRFAAGYRCVYSRYADDMSFSTTRQNMPMAVNEMKLDGTIQCILTPGLRAVIEANGFVINEDKVRLSGRTVRQEVTGLIVNRRVNVKRRFIREIRAMLHAWRKFGLDNAQEEFEAKYNGRSSFQDALRGKIEFVGHVRQRPDLTFRSLAQQFNRLTTGTPIRIALTDEEIVRRAVWVIESDGDIQATAFFVAPGIIVTSAHALGLNPHIFHPSDHLKKFPVVLKTKDDHRDLAALTTPAQLHDVTPLKLYAGTPVPNGTDVMLYGYPNHQIARPVRMEDGKIIRTFPSSAVSYLETTTKIIGGNSGGPILNNRYEVVGVAAQGLNGKVMLHHAEFLAVNATELSAVL